MPGSLYGALPLTGTGQLSVPHQNPAGLSPSGSARAPVTAWAVSADKTAVATPAASRSATHPLRASLHRVTSPPRSLWRFLSLRHTYLMTRQHRRWLGRAEPGNSMRRTTVHSGHRQNEADGRRDGDSSEEHTSE